MINSLEDYREMSLDARRALEREQDELMGKAEILKSHLQILDIIDDILTENERLKRTVDEQQQQLDEQQQQLAESDMKLIEMSKLSAGVAKKASEDNVLKALRTYVNRSKRKTADKRAFAKTATLEIANANGLDLPEDLKTAIESLDDEQVEPKIAIQGDYVVEKKVNQQVEKIENGGIGMKLEKED
jgi:hypothetical protein